MGGREDGEGRRADGMSGPAVWAGGGRGRGLGEGAGAVACHRAGWGGLAAASLPPQFFPGGRSEIRPRPYRRPIFLIAFGGERIRAQIGFSICCTDQIV